MSHPPKNHGSSLSAFLVIYCVILVALAAGLAVLLTERENQPAPRPKSVTTVAPNIPPPDPVAPPAPPPKPDRSRPPADEPSKPVVPRTATSHSPGETANESEPPGQSDIEKRVEELYPLPQFTPLVEIVNHWADVPLRAYPKLVAIKVPVPFEIKQNGKVVARGKLPAGSYMAPLHLNGQQLTLSSSASLPIKTSLPVDQTDFKERIQAKYDAFIKQRSASVEAQRAAERERLKTELETELALAKWNDGSDARFDPMKDSLRQGKAGAYELLDAVKWRWVGQETMDGETYDVGLVMIVFEAAFGVSERELKALMDSGQVVMWFDVESGKEL